MAVEVAATQPAAGTADSVVAVEVAEAAEVGAAPEGAVVVALLVEEEVVEVEVELPAELLLPGYSLGAAARPPAAMPDRPVSSLKTGRGSARRAERCCPDQEGVAVAVLASWPLLTRLRRVGAD